MGWHVTGRPRRPGADVPDDLPRGAAAAGAREALRRINLRDGKPWLDRGRIQEAVVGARATRHPRLMEANEQGTELLLKGLRWRACPTGTGAASRRSTTSTGSSPSNNTFRVDQPVPGGRARRPGEAVHRAGHGAVRERHPAGGGRVQEPDRRRARWRRRSTSSGATPTSADWVEDNEGNERLFHTNQFLVATCFDEARVGTIGAGAEHYLEWKDTAPDAPAEVAAELGVETAVAARRLLVAGMLRPAHLLDMVRHFTLFKHGRRPDRSRSSARYQQYRAVQRGDRAARTGKTRLRGRRARPARRHHLAHPGLGQEPDDGVPRPQDAHGCPSCAASRSSSSPTARTSSGSSPNGGADRRDGAGRAKHARAEGAPAPSRARGSCSPLIQKYQERDADAGRDDRTARHEPRHRSTGRRDSSRC